MENQKHDGTSSTYDVFLSFKGEDGTRDGFTNDIYKALRRKRIKTFKDDEEIKIGADIRPSLFKAIENSRILMVVLCRNYASSTWCLDELAHIIDCYHNKGNQVLIIFYKVEPSDVWNVKNTFETSMIEHENRFGRDSEKVKAWRNALFSVCHLPREDCNNQTNELELAKKIAEDMSSKLPISLPVNRIVGLDSRFETLKPLLNFKSRDKILMLEIFGEGGIGKTTFSLDIYNKINHQFEAASFLANVSEKSNKSSKGLEDLQKTLLSEMGEKTEIMIESTIRGGFEIKRTLGHKRVLLVLDDIDEINQLEALAGGCDWFGSGSCIIITTRDTFLVDNHLIDGGVIVEKYKMEELNSQESLELFCWNAFDMGSPAKEFEGVSSRVVSYAKGVPLALKLLGSNVEGGDLKEWEMVLESFMTIPNEKNFLYDVFISFRDVDGTRDRFTNDIYKALCKKGIYTFKDDEIKVGVGIRSSIFKAIENSRILIVVLCRNYASSTWCLDELAHIIDCYHNKGNQVLIVYYKVEPYDVWNVKNSIEDAMIEHENRFRRDSEKVKAWRNALSSIRHLPRQHYHIETYAPELVRNIAEDISSKLPYSLPMKHAVGLDYPFRTVKPLLNFESCDTILMLEIYGVAGIGKTTFALEIYNKIRPQFEAASFLSNVSEKSNRSTKCLEDLQKTLLSDMGEETESTFKAGFEIKQKLGHKRVLLVLDDIDEINQLEALAGRSDWFGSGSRIIVTTRDKSLVDNHVMDGFMIQKYKMEKMDSYDSQKLFCLHAFNRIDPAKNFEGVSSRLARYAKGVPLTLIRLASLLKGGSPKYCKMELETCNKRITNNEIHAAFAISYDSLDELDQQIFLDIACFFKGERWDYVKWILGDYGFYPNIRSLIMKRLISIDENGCLDMHDIIQDMGRQVIINESPRNPNERSRLWFHKDVLHILNRCRGKSNIEGIILDPPAHEEVYNRNAFENMENLRILIVRNTTFLSAPLYLPNSLRLLDWKGYPSKSFPDKFYPRKIVNFNLPQSSLSLEKSFKKFEDLTSINLYECQSITQIPDVSGAKNLKVLTLDRCHKVVRFDESVGFMTKLVCLSASECTMLESFVQKMYLPSLEVLSFNLCKKLEHFPDVMQKMQRTLKIWMIGTAVKRFPNSIDNLTGLEYIDMSLCTRLADLSNSFFLLPDLVTLKIDVCFQLRKSFKRFKKLANYRSNLVRLPLNDANLSDEDLHIILECFPRLEDLIVSHNKFVSLPKSITRCVNLKNLDVSYCKNLIEILDLPFSLQKIDARYCERLTSMASNSPWGKVYKEKERIQAIVLLPFSDFNHDVFLGYFNNEGATDSFVDLLHQALVNKRINVFIKDKDEIRACIEEIENSRMSIVVLCENYGSSTSCLDELAMITDDKSRNVSAIFYKVEPTDVRHQKKSYAVAMDEHEKVYGKESEKIKTWRNALTKVCELSGLHCKDETYEPELIQKIVKDTLAKVQTNSIVELDTPFEEVKSALNNVSNDTIRQLGIYGASGIGTTTAAVENLDKSFSPILHCVLLFLFVVLCGIIYVWFVPNS